jgi:hypothetical protein
MNRREKIESRLKQVKEQTESAFKCVFDGKLIGEYDGGEYSICGTCSPEEAIVFAKWVLDLEGE